MKISFHTCLLCLFLLSIRLNSTNIYVNDASTVGDIYCTAAGSAGGTGIPSNPYLTLVAGIAAAVNGDVIYVDAGTYSDKDITLSKNLTIQGAGIGITIFKVTTNNAYFMYINSNSTLADFNITGYGDPGNNLGQAITINSGNTASSYSVTLNALSIYNCGSATGYADILINKNSVVNITQGSSSCSWNSADASGGIDVVGANNKVLISNYLFYGNYIFFTNVISNGGALSITGGGTTTTVTVSQTNFTSNEVNTGSDAYGGAIYQNSGNLAVFDCLFNSNKVYNNSSITYGEAVAIVGTAVASFSGSRFTGNMNDNGGTDNYGGAIYASGTPTVSVDSCSFSGNSADATRGIDIYSSASGSNFTITQSSFASVANYDIVAAASTINVTNSGTPTHNGATVNVSGGSFTPVSPSVVSYSGSCPTSIIILPIELTKFEGACINNQITLLWQTATETYNKVFYIEKSTDGVHFNNVGKLNGAGTSNHSINYSFIDASSTETDAYYRFRQFDFNGNSSLSQIIHVFPTCAPKPVSDMVLFPSPTTDRLSLNFTLFENATVSCSIQNDMGQIVFQNQEQNLSSGFQEINLETRSLASGIYFIRIRINEQESIKKFIKT